MASLSTPPQPVRALERGLDVLLAIETNPGVDLKSLHAITGLPKATLLRLLRTLLRRNLVWQRMADGAYLPSRRLHRPPPDTIARLVEIASPIMAGLCDRVNWPSILGVRSGAQMVVIETNRPRSAASHLPLGPVGLRIDMLSTATGRAYFAFCGSDERQEILGALRAQSEDGPAHDPAWLARLVAQTQAQGFGQRDPVYGRDPLPFDDGRNSISVPVIVAGQVIGAINLTWTRRTATAPEIVAAHLGPLREAATAVARELAEG